MEKGHSVTIGLLPIKMQTSVNICGINSRKICPLHSRQISTKQMLPLPQRQDPNRRHREPVASSPGGRSKGPAAAAAAAIKPRDRAGTKSMSTLSDAAFSQL